MIVIQYNMNQIHVNGFSLEIISTRPVTKKNIGGANYYLLQHKSIYKLKLTNGRETKCDAEVWIDGEKVGTWRINNRSQIIVERPANISRKFVFLKENSADARFIGIANNNDSNGLIKVIFKPEKYTDHFDWYSGISSRPFNQYGHPKFLLRSNNLQNGISLRNYQDQNQLDNIDNSIYCNGATALGQHSDQNFISISPINDIDAANITTIMTRLMVDENTNPQLVSLRSALHTTEYPKRLDLSSRQTMPIYY